MSTKAQEITRYPDSVDPVKTDGRDVDRGLADLVGEASHQNAEPKDPHVQEIAEAPWRNVPSLAREDPTYFDRPMLKKSVWSLDIPIYYFLGGAAGAALTLGAALQLVSRGHSNRVRQLSEACHWIGIVGSTGGAGFLIHDLGRPSRFLYMMRVFRPTSPMNMGVWILAGAAPTAITTGLLINRRGIWGRIGEVTGYASGVFGAALAGYTGVLVSNTAIPVWQQSRRWVPVMFMASSASAAASVIDLISADEVTRSVTRVFGAVGRAAEIAATYKTEQVAAAIPKVGEALHRGGPGALWRLATVLTAASLGVSFFAGKSRKKVVIAGWLGAAGSLCLRLAVHYVGNASALDPRASFHQQRNA